ncbi:AraC family transcriptional regulator, partial [Paenibacillus sepulcri]|nr:AraC family transcriptional regulator [Paenibacillus sepulcri]
KNGVLRAAAALLDKIAWELAKYGAAAGLEVGDLNSWNQRVRNMDTINGIKEFIQGLTGRISGYLADRQQDRHALLVQKVVHVIETEYFESLTIEYLAGKVYLSPNYLRVLFKEKKGCTIHEYLTRIRLQKAVELLGDKTLRIHDVARKVGYDNTSYFCSFFYKTQGVTPNEYRKKFL